MAEQPVQGTSIEDIEMGNVKNEADSEAMRQILADMNATEEAPSRVTSQPIPEITRAPPMRQSFQDIPRMNITPMYHPPEQYEDEVSYEEPKTPKYKTVLTPSKNAWVQLFDIVREPILIGLIICILMFPKLHTLGSKYAGWAYSVGGQVSWLGMLVYSLCGAGIWALYKFFA